MNLYFIVAFVALITALGWALWHYGGSVAVIAVFLPAIALAIYILLRKNKPTNKEPMRLLSTFDRTKQNLLMTVYGGMKHIPMNKIKRYSIYRLDGASIYWVLIKGGLEYCFYLKCHKEKPACKWTIQRIEGGEYGKISEETRAKYPPNYEN